MITGKTLAKKIAERLYDKLAFDIQLLDVKKICGICNYFLICSAKNRYHIATLADIVLDVLAEKKVPTLGIDGTSESGWVVVDTGSLIIHMFLPEIRKYYDLNDLWSDAKSVELNLDTTSKPKRHRPKSQKNIKLKN
ncbi:MAG: ribosome silencing factor [bacterium]